MEMGHSLFWLGASQALPSLGFDLIAKEAKTNSLQPPRALQQLLTTGNSADHFPAVLAVHATADRWKEKWDPTVLCMARSEG